MTHPKKILLIDDNSDERELFFQALKMVDRCIKYLYAPDGATALKLLDTEKILPDFIFIDVNMPGMSGPKCLGEIKAVDRLRHIPVAVYTTVKRKDEAEEVKALGASYFVIKPMDFEVLVKIIHFLLTGGPQDDENVSLHVEVF